jgi:HD superfamily phosphohydrolase
MGGDSLRALDEGYTEAVRDPLWGHVYLTPEFSALLSSAPYQKLRRILQLGPTAAVYPGATHTRAAHSIGVYHLARRLLRVLLERGADAWTTETGVKSFLTAALLHDLGHFPYAHSLKELPLEDHEALTARLILAEPLRTLTAQAGADPYLAAAIVDHGLPVHGNAEALFFRKLLSGVLDPDKLDYLNRDARFCGVPYGAQDVDFTFSRLHPHPRRGVDVDSRGIQSVEAILFAKYLMYRSVYWHRTVRVATAMVKKAVSAGLASGALAPEELYGLDDEGLFSLLAGREHPAFALAAAARQARFHSIVAEFPFDPDKKEHRALASPEGRAVREETLAADLSLRIGARVDPMELVVDLPEPISFETGLFIADQGVPFEQSSTVFRAPVVESFSRSLRVVRICAPESFAAAIEPYCARLENE